MHHEPKYTIRYHIRAILVTLITVLLLNVPVYAQDVKRLITRIDSLSAAGLPKSALTLNEELTKVAFKNNDPILLVRSVMYRNKFLSATQVGALTTIIERLQKDILRATYPAKPILHSLLGSVYWKYFQERRNGIYNFPTLQDPGNNMTKWGPGNFFKEMDKQFGLSLADAARTRATAVGTLDGLLEGDSTTRYLRPTLYDILLGRALEFYMTEESSILQPKPFPLTDPGLFGDSQTFADLKLTAVDTNAYLYKGFRHLQQATAFHLRKGDAEAVAELDLRRLFYLYRYARFDTKSDLYLQGLNIITNKRTLKTSADALAMIGKFYHDKQELVKAADHYRQAIARDSTSLGATNAKGYLQNIMGRSLSLDLENPNAPGRPLLAAVNYANVPAIQLKYYKLTAQQGDRWENLPSTEYAAKQASRFHLEGYIRSLKCLREQLVTLPDLHDYKRHRTEFKIDPLDKGLYVIAIGSANPADTIRPELFTLRITGINYTTRYQPDGKLALLVADRSTGKPMSGAQVVIGKQTSRTDKNGMAILNIDENKDKIRIRNADDSLQVTQLPYKDRYSADPDRPIPKTVIFTDRTLYRPGQTVYFKGLRMQSVNNFSTVVAGYKATLKIKLNQSMDVASIPVVSNEFGSFEGSFVLPASVTGYVNIMVGDNYLISLNVSEYKRPKFELSLDRFKGTYRPNDSVKLAGAVTAYSGYGISKARIAIRIWRQLKPRTYALDQKYQYTLSALNNFQINDTIYTDDQGRFRYNFKAAAGKNYDSADIIATYNITTTAIDGNNETISRTSSVVVATNGLAMAADRQQKQIYYNGDPLSYKMWLTDISGTPVNGIVAATAYSLKKPQEKLTWKQWQFQYPDTFIMDSVTFKKNFPNFSYDRNERSIYLPIDTAIGSAEISADSVRGATVDLDMLKGKPSGTYRIIFKSRSARGDTASLSRDIIWYDRPSVPLDLPWVTNIPVRDKNAAVKRFYVGTAKRSYVLIEALDGTTQVNAEWKTLPPGKQQIIDLPGSRNGHNLTYQFSMFGDNRIDQAYFPADEVRKNEKLNVKLMTFRDKLLPGAKDEWKLQIRDNNGKTVPAEILASMYDAALDGVGGGQYNNWRQDLNDNYGIHRYFSWTLPDRYPFGTGIYLYFYNPHFYGITRKHERLKLFSYDFGDDKPMVSTYKVNGKEFATEQARAAIYYNEDQQDIFMNTEKMDQYFTLMRETAIRGNFGYAVTLREPATTPGQGFLKTDRSEYSATPGTLQSATPRTNFNETAFFYPQLRTNDQGEADISFTIPQSLTKWHFQALAHTKDMATGYVDRYVHTQKQLSVSAGMPRFFRSGDTISVAARVANLTDHQLKGRVLMQFFNGLNTRPVKVFADTAAALQSFDLAAFSNRSVNFKLIIPEGLEALTYRIAAEGDEFTDAEENTLPVLSKQVVVTTTMPMMVRPGERRTFTMDQLAAKHSPTLKSKTLTLTYTQNPAWYAIQALPSFSDVADECPEQLFGKYFANSIGAHVVNSSPVIKQVLDQWRTANSDELLSKLEKDRELKLALLEESPWLRDAQTETEQKRRLAILLDINQMAYFKQSALERLQKRQLPDGGFAWFGGNRADSYITRYIQAGLGQLLKANVISKQDYTLQDIIKKATEYSDTLIARADRSGKIKDRLTADQIYAWYARSYFPERPLNALMKQLQAQYLDQAQRQWLNLRKYEQGLIALTLLRNGKPDEAQKIIRSLTETAQHSADLGMYWANAQPAYYWYQAPVETQCLMIELFTEAGGNDKAVDEMKIWLLRHKQTNDWRSTKATAAACFALLVNSKEQIGSAQNTRISVGGTDLNVLKPDAKVEAGTGYLKTNWTGDQIKPAMAKVDIDNKGTSISWGALYWQYQEDADKVKASQSGLALERKYFIVGNNGTIAVDHKHQPKPGDLLKVVLSVKADQDMEYVYLKDSRPAGIEPMDVLSTYKFQGGQFYYMVTRDVSTNFYIDHLAKGEHRFEYQLRVAQPGNYSAGISAIQSMYAPEFNATAASQRITVVAK